MIAVRLPAEIEKRLNALAAATGRTKTYYVRGAIVEYLDALDSAIMSKAKANRTLLLEGPSGC